MKRFFIIITLRDGQIVSVKLTQNIGNFLILPHHCPPLGFGRMRGQDKVYFCGKQILYYFFSAHPFGHKPGNQFLKRSFLGMWLRQPFV